MRADVAMDQLLARKLIHPAILVAINSMPGGKRTQELTPSPGPGNAGGRIEDYYKFILKRVKPYVNSHYRTKPEPQYTGIAGFSFGGIASFYLAYRHPETFGMAGCMSSSMWWDNRKLLHEVMSDRRPLREVASGSTAAPWRAVTCGREGS